MSIFKSLLESPTVQNLINLAEKALFEQFLDWLEKVVERTSTPEDNEALALFLEEAAKRVRENQPAAGGEGTGG